jgi:drug/metabolite transporter (DMT)-like permease
MSRRRFSWKLALLLAAYPVMTTSFVLANKWTTAANAVAIQYTAPLWIFAGAAVLGSIRLSWRRLLPMAVIAAGIVLFLTEPIQGSSLQGNLTALVSGVSFALTIVALRLGLASK